MGLLEIAVLAQSLALATLALRWLLGRREVSVIREGDYKDGRPRKFLALEVGTNQTSEGTHLVDARTGLPVVFTGVRASQLHIRFPAAGRRAKAMILLEGVRIQRESQSAERGPG